MNKVIGVVVGAQGADFGYNESLTCFLQEYVLFRSRDDYNGDGTLTAQAVNNAVSVLIRSGVFTTPRDMQKQALKDYGLVLPDSLFNEVVW